MVFFVWEHYKRPHHVIVLMFQYVTVPHIVSSEILRFEKLVPNGQDFATQLSFIGMTTVCTSNGTRIVVTSPGFARIVSFRPSSLAGGGLIFTKNEQRGSVCVCVCVMARNESVHWRSSKD